MKEKEKKTKKERAQKSLTIRTRPSKQSSVDTKNQARAGAVARVLC